MSRAALAVATLTVGLLLGGCGQSPTEPTAAGDRVTTREVAAPKESAKSDPAKPRTPRAEVSPSLPPGDPGLDAPSVPDPGTAGAEPHRHAARRTVPLEAMLTADTVDMALGGSWARRSGGADECVRPGAALAERAMSYGSSSAGVVVETVATYRDDEAADSAVAGIGRAAAGCGWTDARDPRLGSASVAADNGDRSMLAVSTEGVVVLLIGTGDVTRQEGRWSSLVDLALGSSCPAAPDGCH